ncbi:uncharacterized protein KGF55_004738 [Candida pseudojiufengensis]|uniref:uncharacterized protein n=1 Tax=Candida pseudojiufengensis TaxID=497109 RepID=UPI0022243399|nr:uncharacterized protein KGF55_004738 [Candida pseudojiufengensis]KAI5960445.1 hypothetical protein KGF55_004738 [Candida pseudojiufengensis]
MTILFNYQNNEIVSSPTVIVSGSTSLRLSRGVIGFTNNDNKVFPPQYFEVNNGQFKAILHVSPGLPNSFKAEIYDNALINSFGFPDYNGKPHVVDSGFLKLCFNPLPQNKPVYLCLIRGKDSRNVYDMPGYRLARGERPTLENAIKKLKVSGRLMQAYYQDEMRTAGFSNRSIQFVEETVSDQSIFGYNVNSPTPHQEIKVFVLTSPKSVKELRSPDLAQQNPNAKDSGGLFSHAIDLIKSTPEIFNSRNDTAVQCVVMYLDSTYDKKRDLILTHAALGGGTNDVKLGIFGSHGLHSFPQNFPLVTPSFLDDTPLSKSEVANDAGQCSTSYECLNICFGAWIHEASHSFGCPHQVDGVMLRDYVVLNRSFMTRELRNERTHSSGEIIGTNGRWSSVCHFNILDLIRFLYHDSFSLPIDNFGKSFSTTKRPDHSYEFFTAPSSYPLTNSSVTKSDNGIFLLEIVDGDLARYHQAYLPHMYGGVGLQTQIEINYQEYLNKLRSKKRDANDAYKVRVLSLGGDLFIDNFKAHSSQQHKDMIESDFGLGKGKLKGAKSLLLGKANGQIHYVNFNIKSIFKVSIYSGNALNGFRFHFNADNTSKTPGVPERNYLKKFFNNKPNAGPPVIDSSGFKESVKANVLVGRDNAGSTDFVLEKDEYIIKFNIRNGAWIDAIQFVTNKRVSPMFGNAKGGHLSVLESPTSNNEIVGMYFYMGDWLDGLGIIYTI